MPQRTAMCCEPGSIIGDCDRNQCGPQGALSQHPMCRSSALAAAALLRPTQTQHIQNRNLEPPLQTPHLCASSAGATVHPGSMETLLEGRPASAPSSPSTSSALCPLTFLSSLRLSPSQCPRPNSNISLLRKPFSWLACHIHCPT